LAVRLLALPVVDGLSVVMRHPALPGIPVGDTEGMSLMDAINLDPKYSTSDVPGKCIKCLAEQELNNCLLELLRAEGDDKELVERFEMLISFLKSPESLKLRDESERCLAEGKRVTVGISFEDGKPKYELKINQ
jgi:hypothetical protein